MIEIKNISKSFNGVQILKDISFTFHKGKTNLIIGQSGSGKSVLTKCIVGLHEVDKGQVIYGDRVFSSMDKSERKNIRQEIGMLFQGSALFDSLSVEENVMFPLKMFKRKAFLKSVKKTRNDSCFLQGMIPVSFCEKYAKESFLLNQTHRPRYLILGE